MAAKINVNEIKNGATFMYSGDLYMMLESSHSKSGRGQATVKGKVRNLFTGSNTMISFTGGEKVETAFVTKTDMQYLYNDGVNASFMNNENFEQVDISLKLLGKDINYLPEGESAKVTTYEGRVLGVELGKSVTLEVIEAPDAVAGNTATNATKKVKLSTGLEVDTPQFIKPGDKIIVSTSTGKYNSKG